jgi:ATP phosphoribosyltransferase
MGSTDKARRLKLIDTSYDISQDIPKEEKSVEKPSRTVIESLLVKARNVLDDAEGEWEIDHNKADLRDKFHLLRYYIDNLRQCYEGNI